MRMSTIEGAKRVLLLIEPPVSGNSPARPVYDHCRHRAWIVDDDRILLWIWRGTGDCYGKSAMHKKGCDRNLPYSVYAP